MTVKQGQMQDWKEDAIQLLGFRSRNSLLHVTFTFLCFVICRKQKRFRKKIEQQHTCIDALTEKKTCQSSHPLKKKKLEQGCSPQFYLEHKHQ